MFSFFVFLISVEKIEEKNDNKKIGRGDRTWSLDPFSENAKFFLFYFFFIFIYFIFYLFHIFFFKSIITYPSPPGISLQASDQCIAFLTMLDDM